MAETLVDAGIIAERLSVPKSWVYAKAKQGDIPYRRVGKYLRFSWDEVLESLPGGKWDE